MHERRQRDQRSPDETGGPGRHPGGGAEGCRRGPWGARGIGEHSMVPTIPAIANAIYDAVGIRLDGPPFTAEKVFLAMMDAGIVN